MNGKSLKNFIIAGALFFLFIFTFITDPSYEAEQIEATEKDKSIKPTKVIYKTEHSKLETVQKEKTKISKPNNDQNLIKSCKNRVECNSKSDKVPIQDPKKVKIEKGTYRIVFIVYGLM